MQQLKHIIFQDLLNEPRKVMRVAVLEQDKYQISCDNRC